MRLRAIIFAESETGGCAPDDCVVSVEAELPAFEQPDADPTIAANIVTTYFSRVVIASPWIGVMARVLSLESANNETALVGCPICLFEGCKILAVRMLLKQPVAVSRQFLSMFRSTVTRADQ
jgi:hypothetical protein